VDSHKEITKEDGGSRVNLSTLAGQHSKWWCYGDFAFNLYRVASVVDSWIRSLLIDATGSRSTYRGRVFRIPRKWIDHGNSPPYHARGSGSA